MPKDKELAKTKSKVELSDEERERRRQNMQKLRDEGKIGPQFGKLGGRPRKPRATEMIAERARQHSEEIAQVFIDAIDPEQPMKVRLEAANSFAKIDRDEAQLKLQEDKFDVEHADKNELVTYLAGILEDSPVGAAIIEGFVDSTAEVDENTRELESGTASGDSEGS